MIQPGVNELSGPIEGWLYTNQTLKNNGGKWVLNSVRLGYSLKRLQLSQQAGPLKWL